MPRLASAFLAGAGATDTGAQPVLLEARLAGCVADARAAWPAIELPDTAFAAHLGERASNEAGLAGLHVNDLFLACACLGSLPEALASFDAAFLAQLDPHLRRYDSSPTFADEVRQILRERFFVWVRGAPPRIAGYSGRGALGGWVRVAAVRVALRLSARQGSPQPEAESILGPDPELEYVRVRYRAAFVSSLSEALAALEVEDRNLLRLHFVEGLTIDGLAPIYRVHRSTAARRLAEARERLLAGTRERLRDALGVSGRELDSLVGLVQSRIEINISSLFRPK